MSGFLMPMTFLDALTLALERPETPEVPTPVEFSDAGPNWYAPPALRRPLLEAAAAEGLDPRLLDLQFNQESRYNPRAVGTSGEQGIGQLMPATSRSLGVKDPFDPVQNMQASARYLAYLTRTLGDPVEAMKAYNVGIGNVRAGKKTGLADTYVRAVLTPKRFRRPR
jgi:soluble lytic murein transglycosylase-like protein